HDPSRGVSGLLIAAVVRSNDAKALDPMVKLVTTAAEPDRSRLTKDLGMAAALQRKGPLAEQLLALAVSDKALARPVVDGLLAGRKAAGSKFKPITLKSAPPLLSNESILPDAKRREQLAAVFNISAAGEVSFLKTDEHRRLFDLGKQHYAVICGACHQPHGKGQEFISPPLVDSEWVLGPPKRLIAIALDGAMGPITVDGQTYTIPQIQPVMPGLRINPEIDDEKLAAMLTYVRNEWGNGATPITPDMVKAYRDETEVRAPHTEAELKSIK
ncbi:MAG: cytochrome c, partial [Verrucomicrobiae bacterium]|nr:cytochrome c [Verrucomicrobiae bacterium]